MTSVLSGCLLEPATGFTGSSMIMALLCGCVFTFAASDNQLSSVYCSNVLGDGAVVDSTALTGCGGGRETCLVAARLAASFHVLPDMAFSNRRLANGSITSVMHSEVSPVFWLSQWRIFSSSSISSVHSVTSMDANLNMYPILFPPVSNTFHFCHHPQPHHSQPYHTQSIIYHPSFIINGNSRYRAYSTIISIFPIFSRLSSPLRPPLNSVK